MLAQIHQNISPDTLSSAPKPNLHVRPPRNTAAAAASGPERSAGSAMRITRDDAGTTREE
jgi:hypothetical protein